MALVTGSSRGIGEAVARGLAREGATVIIHGRNPSRTASVVQDILAQGGQAHGVTGDLTDENQTAHLLDQAKSLGVDILVNNAGGSGQPEDWTDTRTDSWAASFDRNVLAAVRAISALLPGMRAARWGRIVNISSMAALMPAASRPDYSAAKAAMHAMTASLAKTVASEGITVNTLSPGTIHSESLDRAFRQAAAERGMDADAPWPDIERAMLPVFAPIPMGRVGTLEEITDAIAFLVSPRAAYITGANLRLDGGMWPGL
ncbi:short chain dehydrogenase family protein [Bordetella holmesii 30539]|uniref:Short chain dehydrogenase family protein n=1 Tax=Bordetella holmesii 1058 TaxID=1247648 RepID=A0ABP3BGW1_9BORD|nr:short chain dehydrogenase family protein [Bordetella holmesii ATCC 51541]AIT28449.1 short chain dehydrogenase family protein [Bordetella holmesii 44057]EWM43489.1 short chain dehydrogenase family protein [Bordetella holmesii 41130]EXF88445.1 short chain dehydrogenase family protein [Bordetella holmesii 30539]EXX94446.1 short chain dehydrogenase family protein [Bordetella holmesii 1058]